MRQSSESGSFGGTSSCVLGASCTTGGTAACDESVADCCCVPRFRVKTLFDLCCAAGKPVLDPFGVEGADEEEPRFRSKTEPTRGLLCSDINLIAEADAHNRSRMEMAVKNEEGVSGWSVAHVQLS
jgi:hypothetical protein